ncbi:type VI secretion system lipoprotein TssJ [Caballeronia ptereochthonis]|nr:type VI secretion system lipoprotein TssJ [Caballeronia ptereochthonis]
MLKCNTAVSAALALLLAGCGAWQAVSDSSIAAYDAVFHKRVKVLDVDLTARVALNQDDAGRSTSVAVRVYQLKDRKRFDSASYDDLIKRDTTVLAQDLQANMAAVVNPGASASLSQAMQKEAGFVAVAAFYRDPPADDSWKQVVAAKTLSADEPLKLTLVDNRLMPDEEARSKKAR